MSKLPSIHEITSSREPEQAAWWRRHVVGLSQDQLAQETGYTAETIFFFERGTNRRGRPIAQREWMKYRATCAGVDAKIRGNRKFTWGIKQEKSDAQEANGKENVAQNVQEGVA
jgi:hypothetical protein